MKKPSLTQILTSKFRAYYLAGDVSWKNGGAIERFALNLGYKASNASRRLREMESGIASNNLPCPIVLEKTEHKLENSKVASVWYRYLPSEKERLSFNQRYNEST